MPVICTNEPPPFGNVARQMGKLVELIASGAIDQVRLIQSAFSYHSNAAPESRAVEGAGRSGGRGHGMNRRSGRSSGMVRLDRYQVIGLILLGLLAALWIAHFVLPAPPPVAR